MADFQSVEALLEAFDGMTAENRVVVDATLDGETPVKVLALVVDEGIFSGALIPLAILLEGGMYERVTPPGDFDAETTEDAKARIRGEVA